MAALTVILTRADLSKDIMVMHIMGMDTMALQGKAGVVLSADSPGREDTPPVMTRLALTGPRIPTWMP